MIDANSKQPRKLRLVSFNLCPFVRRSVITLIKKNVDFEIDYIDLADKPDWFMKLSPMGKVPVLQVGDKVLFESAVINEYLDETTEPHLHPVDPLAKAENRAWIEFGSSLIGALYMMANAKDAEGLQKQIAVLKSGLARIEGILGEGPFFNGPEFSLVDTSYAPAFSQIDEMQSLKSFELLDDTPKVKAWSAALLAEEAVQLSVTPNYGELYKGWLKSLGGIFH